MSIFVKREIKNSLIHKISKKNFLIEVENCLADYENSLESLSGSRIKEIASKYRISLDIDFLEERIDLLKRYLDLFFEKLYLSDSEFHSIRHFSNIICLPENVFNKQYEDFASACYEMRIKQYLTDEVITSSERLALEDLRNKLRLSPEVANNIYKKAVKVTMDRFTKPIFDSERFSPQDEERMYDAAKKLGLNLTFPPEIQKKFTKYRGNWELENGKLPVIKSDIRLQDGEYLHFKTYAKWMEERTVTTRVNYSGFSYSKKIIGNVRWKVGTYTPKRIQSTELKELDVGSVYITSKRIIFNGQHENKVISYKKLINFQPYTDGILLEKNSGKSPFLAFDNEIEQAAIILANLLS